ncbi:hypothetical protein niasHS_003337 [Heterodera schachtii]|uniref:Sushi domain-containing protein n=1 Tax=Heterodera schachtii TaxID=97005 RepID=A0ABD2KG79_HETSC
MQLFSLAFLFLSFSEFGISVMAYQNRNVQRHSVFKRQSNACLFGMVPPLGASVQYSQGGGIGTNAVNAVGALPLSASSAGPFPSGTTATMFCLQGGVPAGPSTAVCLNGIWQPPFFSAGCSLSSAFGGVSPSVGLSPSLGGFSSTGQCLTPISPLSLGLGNVFYSNGENQFSGPYSSGTIATLQCPAGQIPSGATTATCLNGFWQPNMLGSCSQTLNGYNATRAQEFGPTGREGSGGALSPLSPFGGSLQNCPVGPSPPLNGFVQFSSGSLIGSYPIGTTATLICNPGFVPSGQASAICQVGGQFLPSILGPCIANGKRRRR